jgi:hypothetical protein
MGFSNNKQIALEADKRCNQHCFETVQRLNKQKTINVTNETHKALRAYCLQAGLKLQAVADKAILSWLRKAAK